jgi:hypothetical protein
LNTSDGRDLVEIFLALDDQAIGRRGVRKVYHRVLASQASRAPGRQKPIVQRLPACTSIWKLDAAATNVAACGGKTCGGKN